MPVRRVRGSCRSRWPRVMCRGRLLAPGWGRGSLAESLDLDDGRQVVGRADQECDEAFVGRAEVQEAQRPARVSGLAGSALVPGRVDDDQGVHERGQHRSERRAQAREFPLRGARPVLVRARVTGRTARGLPAGSCALPAGAASRPGTGPRGPGTGAARRDRARRRPGTTTAARSGPGECGGRHSGFPTRLAAAMIASRPPRRQTPAGTSACL